VIRIGRSQMRLEAVEEDDAGLRAAAEKPVSRPGLHDDWAAGLVGQNLGRHTVGPILGRGHCGVVFRAHDRKRDRTIALKVLSPEFPRNDREKDRFMHAMRAMIPLRHPNLVAVHGVGITKPYCWMALEYIPGKSLTQVIRRLRRV